MFDIVGKRRWYFLFSALITIPGLIFILLTPISGGTAGLKFSIDYTGGTTWTIRFEDPTVTAEQVRAKLVELDQPDATVVRTGRGYFDIRLSKLDLREVQPTPTPIPTPSAAPSGTPAPTGTPAPSDTPGATPTAVPSPTPAGTPDPSASPGPSAEPTPTATPEPTPTPTPSPTPSPTPVPSPTPTPPTGNTQIPTEGDLGKIANELQREFGPIAEQLSLSSIGAIVSSDLVGQAVLLIIVGSIGILLWITYRFKDFKMGATALVALLHDVIVVIGIFAMLGTFVGIEIDGLFVTAMLTVIGFSVHDTIVVFDRIRENRIRHSGEPFAEIVNHSLLQTFGRSITTSFTVVLTLTALLLFGGSATQEFVLALLIGIVSGTYSSIFNASPLLVVWQEYEDRKHGRQTARPVRRAGA